MLTVMFCHNAGGIFIKPINFYPISSILFAGPVSVSYLYVLSGFVMSLIYYRPQEKFNVRGYWSTRFVRVYPMYILSFLLTCLYYYDFIARIKPAKILSNLFLWQAWIPKYSQSFNPASWSLSVEGFFYFIFPFFVMWAYRQSMKKLINLSVILWIVSQVIHYVLWTQFMPAWEEFLLYFPLFHLNSFILGAVGGIWFVSEAPKHPVNSKTNSVILWGTFALVVIFLLLGDAFPNRVPRYLQTLAGILSPLLVVTIITLARDTTRLSTIMNQKWLVTLGETSYALYIFHIPVRWWYERLLVNIGINNTAPVLASTFLPLIILISLLLFLYVDFPLRRQLRKIVDRVSMPLLLLDLGAIALSIYLSFSLRFDTTKEFSANLPVAYAMFWSALLIRIGVSIAFKSVSPDVLGLPFKQMLYRILFAVTAGSAVVGLLMFAFFSLGWLENLPRSILLLDWGMMLLFSTLIRLAVKKRDLYQVTPAAVKAN
jgi:peptidoglycan/LPS O-acetylase OafA/YrhL